MHSVITREVAVAKGAFAPGHLGELTRIVPFELIDAVLAETGSVQRRIRQLPSRVVVYLLLAAALFEGLGYCAVWRKLTAGLDGLAVGHPSASALAQACKRLGVAPLRALFDLLRGPAATALSAGTRWRGLLVCAIDGTMLNVPDAPGNAGRWGKHGRSHREAGYPQVRLLALVACGTRAIIDATFGPTSTGETGYATRLLASLRNGMIVLLDRGFDSGGLLAAIAGTEADFLVRIKHNRVLPVLQRYPDGSWLSRLGGVKVRIVECQITIATTAGHRAGAYRLATTLTDHRRYPAIQIVTLYHERWEIETAYLELKTTLLGNRVLRARTPTGIEQEIYALLAAYQILRTAIVDATDTVPGADPDRASFTIALQTARDQIILAAGVIAATAIDLIGTIGRHVLDNLMPTRRLRVSPRVVKRPLSRYASKEPRISRRTYKATSSIEIHAAPDP